MSETWRNIKPLRVASGWSIDINNFYQIDPSENTMDWFHCSVLISGHSTRSGLCFDARYEPEGDPEGEFVVDFLTLDKKEKRHVTEFLGFRKTRNVEILGQYIEEFMFTEKLPNEVNSL